MKPSKENIKRCMKLATKYGQSFQERYAVLAYENKNEWLMSPGTDDLNELEESRAEMVLLAGFSLDDMYNVDLSTLEIMDEE